jgi:Protein of unknown function (DUF4238)
MPENKNQHYIPIKLLTEFLIPNEAIKTYKHRKEIIKEQSIKNLFSKDYYYGKKDSEEYADDVISFGEHNYVNKLLPVLLETNGKLSRANKKLAANFTAHFLIRRSLNRDLILKTVEHYYLDKKDADAHVNAFMSLISLFIKDPLLNSFRRKQVLRLLLFIFTFAVEIVKMHVNNDRQDLKRQSKDIHNKIIISENSHEIVAEFCMGFNWTVMTSGIDLILGDTICFFGNKDGTFSPFDSKQVSRIFVPISSRKMLVGFKGRIHKNIDFRQLNYHNSCCSYAEFICCSKTEESEQLVNYIGLNFKNQQNTFIESNNVITDNLLKFWISQASVGQANKKYLLEYISSKYFVGDKNS